MKKQVKLRKVAIILLVVILLLPCTCQGAGKEVVSGNIINEVKISDIEKYKADFEKKYSLTNEDMHYMLSQEASEQLTSHELNYNSKINSFKDIKIKINSSLINTLIANKWSQDTLIKQIGRYDNIFRMYRVYFEKGLRVKVLNNRVESIVFDKKYKDSVVNGLSIKSKKKDVIRLLGQPNFQNSDENLIGYKTKNLYIFFVGDNEFSEISVYRRDVSYDENGLVKSLDLFKGKKDLIEIVETIWKDFDWEMNWSAVRVNSYNSRGVLVTYDEGDLSAEIDVFGNFEGKIDTSISLPKDKSKIKNLKSKTFKFHLDKDSIFDYEQYRILINKKLLGQKISEQYNLGMAFDDIQQRYSTDKKKVAIVKPITVDDNYSCLYVLFLNGEKQNRELKFDSISGKTKWIDNRYLECVDDYNSYIYDTEKDDIIPLPKEYFGNNFAIISVTNDKIIYKKL